MYVLWVLRLVAQFQVMFDTQVESVVSIHFFLSPRSAWVETGLNRLGMNHINPSLLIIIFFLGANLGVIRVFAPIKISSPKIRIFSAHGRMMGLGEGMSPLSQNPPEIDGISRMLGPTFNMEFASISWLNGSRLVVACMRNTEKRREYSRVSIVAAIIMV